jgi:hypothetical protein
MVARYTAEAGVELKRHVVSTCKTEMALYQSAVSLPFPLLACNTMSLPDVLQFATDPREKVALVGLVVFLFLAAVFVVAFVEHDKHFQLVLPETVRAYMSFAYSCFLKPHTGDSNGSQQEALESFYKSQANAYDTTRTRLLRGREDMLGLVASQLRQKEFTRKPVWVDVCTFLRPAHSPWTDSTTDWRRYWLEY